MKKYELTNETIEVEGYVLHRIKALIDFGDVKAGDLGGFIEDESNLSHEANCWVYDNAMVYQDAKVQGYAEVHGHAKVYGNAYIGAWSLISEFGSVYGNAKLYGSHVYGHAKVYDNVLLHCHSSVVHIYGNAEVYENAILNGGMIEICDNAKVHGDFQTNPGAGFINIWENDDIQDTFGLFRCNCLKKYR